MPLMLDMMMETLASLGPDPARLRAEAEEYVARLTGQDTYFQMAAFAGHVSRLGGDARSGEQYKAEFMARLEVRRSARLQGIADGLVPPDALLIPGTRALLAALFDAGFPLYLASGSDHNEIVTESRLLEIDRYFTGIHGSSPAQPTKRELLRKLVDSGIPPPAILTFGDGRTEIEETALIGGVAVGVASDEPDCASVDTRKRGWLIDAGAHYIIPNYLEPGLMDLVQGKM